MGGTLERLLPRRGLWRHRDEEGVEKKLEQILQQQLTVEPRSFEANARLSALYGERAALYLALTRDSSRIHVTEEARHVSYAREAVLRQTPALGRCQLFLHR